MKTSSGLLFAALGVSQAFTTLDHSNNARTVELTAQLRADEQTRRRFVVSTTVVAGASTLFTRPVLADISDGNTLPQGAAQFSRLLKVKTDIAVVAKRVSEMSNEIEKKEWDNIGQFLRRLYAAGDDMKGIAKGIYDPAKKKQADEDIKQLQNYAKAAEGPVNKRDGDAFVAVMSKCESLVDDFFELLRDVPDEL